jgi:hypothetical protein
MTNGRSRRVLRAVGVIYFLNDPSVPSGRREPDLPVERSIRGPGRGDYIIRRYAYARHGASQAAEDISDAGTDGPGHITSELAEGAAAQEDVVS